MGNAIVTWQPNRILNLVDANGYVTNVDLAAYSTLTALSEAIAANNLLRQPYGYVDIADIPGVSTYYTKLASLGIPTQYVRRGDGTWTVDGVSWESKLPDLSGFTWTYVFPNAAGASNNNNGLSPVLGGGNGPLATMAGIISDTTPRVIVLEAGAVFSASTGWATQDPGADKVIISSVPGTKVYVTARHLTAGSVSWAWNAGNSLWLCSAVSADIANVVLPNELDAYGEPRVCYAATSLANCQATQWSCWYVAGQGLYLNTGSSTTTPTANALIHQNSARHLHTSTRGDLYCKDISFQGGSVVFASLNGQQIDNTTNASPIEVTTKTAHGLLTGDLADIVGHQGNTNANGTGRTITKVTDTKYTIDGTTGNGAGTVNTGYSTTNTPILDVFCDCEFLYGGNSSTGSNIAEFNGNGSTYLFRCYAAHGKADGIDLRNGRYVLAVDCEGAFTGHLGSTRTIDQAITAHADSYLISVNSEWHHTGGPCTQNATEQGLPSYQIHLGDYFHSTLGVSSPASNYLFVAGIGITGETSRMWVIDPKLSDRDGGNATARGSRIWRANKGSMYIKPVWATAEKTIDTGGAEVPIAY